MALPTIQSLRAHAVSHSLFKPTTLKSAIGKLGFIQADPIRSPARAQDLILRHRVKNYHAGDLERHYPSLDIEEDFLYAYGFISRSIWQLLHPRQPKRLSAFENKVLETVHRLGVIHPREMEAHHGKDRVTNDWGGYSKATTRALEALHHRGLLRIARRDGGIRIYEASPPREESVSPNERLRKLILILANIFAPMPEKSLRTRITRLKRLGNPGAMLNDLLRTGELERQTIDSLAYIAPTFKTVEAEIPQTVRFLAPFDPVVWDRRRFEHLWNWAYRFEAYTPIAKRVRGYYAMPLLWGTEVIGWANASVVADELRIDVGFVKKKPTGRGFRDELDLECQRLAGFLKLNRKAGTRINCRLS